MLRQLLGNVRHDPKHRDVDVDAIEGRDGKRRKRHLLDSSQSARAYLVDPGLGQMGLVGGAWRPASTVDPEGLVEIFQLDAWGLYAVFHAPSNDHRSWPKVERIMAEALRPLWSGDNETLAAWIAEANRNSRPSPACDNQWDVPHPCNEYAQWRLKPPHLRIPETYELTKGGGFYRGDYRLSTDQWLLSVNVGSWNLQDAAARLRVTPDGIAQLDGLPGFEGETTESYAQKVNAWLAAHELPAASDIALNGTVC
jgi:hypothetical protein